MFYLAKVAVRFFEKFVKKCGLCRNGKRHTMMVEEGNALFRQLNHADIMWMIRIQSFYRAAVNGATIGKPNRACKKWCPLFRVFFLRTLAAVLGRLFLLSARVTEPAARIAGPSWNCSAEGQKILSDLLK